MRKSLALITLTCVMSGILVVSCKKDDSSSVSTAEKQEFATAASTADAEGQIAFNEVFDNVLGVNNEVAIGGTGVFAGANPSGDPVINGPQGEQCYTLTITHMDQNEFFPVQAVIDFGAGCVGKDGKTRKGKIIIEYSARIITPGAVATTVFDGYQVDGVKVEGTHTITNLSSQTELKFNVTVLGKLTKENGNSSVWNSDRTITMVAGLSTPLNPADDIFSCTGSANGVVTWDSKVHEWSAEIINPLLKKFSCQWLVQGTINFKKGSQVYGSIDYGSGDCDNKATLSVNGQTAIITLH